MKNETDLSGLWGELFSRGTAALRPNFARRVMQRMAAAREEFNARNAFVVGLGTALACLALTIAVNLWSIRSASDSAIAQWTAFAVDESGLDAGI